MVRRLHQRCSDERGVVLALVAILMVVFMGMAALAIDVGYFYQQERQAQDAADAAALAGANDLPTSTTLATSDAQSYVAKNMPGVPTTCTAGAPGICVTTPYRNNTGQIQVTVTKTVPSFFGHIFGISSADVSGTAVAQVTPGSAQCSTPGVGCYALWAADPVCSSNTGIFLNGGGYNFQGGVHSNGTITATGGGNTFGGPTTYGPGTGCLNTSATLPSGSGPVTPSPVHPPAPSTYFPVPYGDDYPACSASLIPCNAAGTPSFCSASAANYTFSGSSPPTSGYIYCAYGTTTTKADPTTWNGTVTFSGGAIGSAGNLLVASYVAGNIFTGSGGNYLATCGYSTTTAKYVAANCKGASGQTMPTPSVSAPNYPLFYAADSSSNVPSGDTYTVNLGGGGNTWQGDIFAPVGQVVVSAGAQTTGFIEAYDIGFASGGIFSGDGSADSGGTTPAGAVLVQ